MSWFARSIAERKAVLEGNEPEWLRVHPRRSYVRQRIIATPPWPGLRVKLTAMNEFKVAGYSWDHVVPLNHPNVCGLHVPWNLERIPHSCNAAKNNRWNPHQADMFGRRVQQELAL